VTDRVPQKAVGRPIVEMTDKQTNDTLGAIAETSTILQLDDHYRGPLWHYTTAQGAKGILENKTLRASDVRYLNDPNEEQLMLRAMVAASNSRLREAPGKPLRGPAALVAGSGLTDIIRSDYVASFSSLADDLLQWRLYAEDGAGYAIEFDSAKLVDRIEDRMLVECRYLPETELEAICTTILDTAEGRGRKEMLLGGIVTARATQEIYIRTATLMGAPIFKDLSYQTEKEVRLLQLGPQRLRGVPDPHEHRGRLGRLRGTMFIPYKALDVAGAIRSVMIGPTAAGDVDGRHAYGLRAFLDANGLPDVAVEVSGKPYQH